MVARSSGFGSAKANTGFFFAITASASPAKALWRRARRGSSASFARGCGRVKANGQRRCRSNGSSKTSAPPCRPDGGLEDRHIARARRGTWSLCRAGHPQAHRGCRRRRRELLGEHTWSATVDQAGVLKVTPRNPAAESRHQSWKLSGTCQLNYAAPIRDLDRATGAWRLVDPFARHYARSRPGGRARPELHWRRRAGYRNKPHHCSSVQAVIWASSWSPLDVDQQR